MSISQRFSFGEVLHSLGALWRYSGHRWREAEIEDVVHLLTRWMASLNNY